MVGISLKGQAELYAKLCEPDKAKQVYNSAHTILKERDATEGAAVEEAIKNVDDMCDLALWCRTMIFKPLHLFLTCMVLCSLLVRRRWRQRKKKPNAK